MTADSEVAKVSAESVVVAALDGIVAGQSEVLADDVAAGVKAGLALDPPARYAQILGDVS